jgi:hypothetical protein
MIHLAKTKETSGTTKALRLPDLEVSGSLGVLFNDC